MSFLMRDPSTSMLLFPHTDWISDRITRSTAGLKYVGINAGNMDVTVVYSTDGLNKRFGLVTLEDDLHFFPEYNGAYLLRADLYEDFPELEAIFQELAGKFDNEICTDLNYRIDVKVEEPKKVAREFLEEHNMR